MVGDFIGVIGAVLIATTGVILGVFGGTIERLGGGEVVMVSADIHDLARGVVGDKTGTTHGFTVDAYVFQGDGEIRVEVQQAIFKLGGQDGAHDEECFFQILETVEGDQ